MENLINCPGLHHIAEDIFLNLTPSSESIYFCKNVNKSWKFFLNNPLFNRKQTWFVFRKCSQHKKFGNKNAWREVIELNKDITFEEDLTRYLEELFKHLEECQIDLNWCCMNINNALLSRFIHRTKVFRPRIYMV